MLYEVEDTIVAIASAPGPSLRGILRISGPDAVTVSHEIIDKPSKARLAKQIRNLGNTNSTFRFATKIAIAECRRPLKADVLVWPTNRSFTGQPCVEIHTIGSTPILQLVLQSIIDAGCRMAAPGEFTMRAFLCGRLDLTQAEAVLGMIDARNEQQFETSLQQMAGGIAGPVSRARDAMVAILAELEAGLDFVEEDIEFVSNDQIITSLKQVQSELSETLDQLKQRRTAVHFTRVILTGLPNTGKSSLFNAIAGTDAIVSDVAGTTRDYLTADVVLDNTTIRLTDTAGIDDTDSSTNGSIDAQMNRQAKDQLRIADIILHCQSVENVENSGPTTLPHEFPGEVIAVRTKCDLVIEPAAPNGIATSATSGQGIDELKSAIAAAACRLNSTGHSLSESALRTEKNLEQALNSVESALDAAVAGRGEEIVAAEIRSALDEIGRIVGIIYTDDILDVVFSRFCIGK